MPRWQTPPKKRKACSCASRAYARGAHDEDHLLTLAGINLNQIHPAVAQTHVRSLHLRRRAQQNRVLVAPVELVGLAGIENQRYVGLRRRRQPTPTTPCLGIAANRVVPTLVALIRKVLVDLHKRQANTPLLLLILFQKTLQSLNPRPKLRQRLNLALIRVRGRITPNHLAYRVLRDPQIPGQLLDRNTLHQMIPTNPRNRLHYKHLPLAPSVQRRGAFMGQIHGGSILDADHPQ